MSLCLAIASGKGGTGKSTFACSIALAFERENKKVLIIDLDKGLRCLDIFFGVDSDIVYDLSDALCDSMTDAVYTIPQHNNISLIPAPNISGEIDPTCFAEFLSKMDKEYDIIILDFPAGLDFSAVSKLKIPSQFIIVCNADPVSVRDAAVVSNTLSDTGIEPRLILNRFDIELIKGGYYKNIDDIIDTAGLRLLGIVPNDTEFMLLPVKHTIKKRGRAARSIKRIAQRILGRQIDLPKPKKI